MSHYLDHNATSSLRPEAHAAALEAMDCTGNASSIHGNGRHARALLEDAREKVASLVDCAPLEVVFTSGGTEANNLALLGWSPRSILISAVEHPSVASAIPGAGIIPVDHNGCVAIDALDALIRSSPGPVLVSIMAANNETGVIEPLDDVIAMAHGHGALVHCDAVQAAGRFRGAWQNADLLTLSAHKLGGMSGAGALIVRDTVKVASRSLGGGQEYGRRAGTEPLVAIASFGAAAVAASMDDGSRLKRLRDTMQARMQETVPGSTVFAEDALRLDNTLAIAHPEIDAETMVMGFDLQSVAISAGSACSSGTMAASAVITAMGYPELARHAVRLSLGWSTVEEDCDAATRVWAAIDARPGRRRKAA